MNLSESGRVERKCANESETGSVIFPLPLRGGTGVWKRASVEAGSEAAKYYCCMKILLEHLKKTSCNNVHIKGRPDRRKANTEIITERFISLKLMMMSKKQNV